MSSNIRPYPLGSLVWNANDVSHWMGAREVFKAQSYIDNVFDLMCNNTGTITSKVYGTENIPYKQSIFFSPRLGGQLSVEGACSCPVGYKCKHIAAALLAYIDRFDGRDEHTSEKDSNSTLQKLSLAGQQSAELPLSLLAWVDRFSSQNIKKNNSQKKSPPHILAYELCVKKQADGIVCGVKVLKVGFDRYGHLKSNSRELDVDGVARTQTTATLPQYISEQDVPLLETAWRLRQSFSYETGFVLNGKQGAKLLEALVQTDRFFFNLVEGSEPTRLTLGEERHGELYWQAKAGNSVRPALRTVDMPSLVVISVNPPWYFDDSTKQMGPVSLNEDADGLLNLLTMPAVPAHYLDALSNKLKGILPNPPQLPSKKNQTILPLNLKLTPKLVFSTHFSLPQSFRVIKESAVDAAELFFEYGPYVFSPTEGDQLFKNDDQGRVVEVQRDQEAEKDCLSMLIKAGFRAGEHSSWIFEGLSETALSLKSEEEWQAFIHSVWPTWQAQGWNGVMEASFRHNVIQVDDLTGEISEGDAGWFDLQMGIRVGETVLQLGPLLVELFARDNRWLGGQLDQISNDEWIELKATNNQRLQIKAERLKPVVRVLIDLFDGFTGEGPIRVSQWDAGRLEALENTARWEFHGDASRYQLAQRLKESAGVQHVVPPKGLEATLRPYQQQGLSWMQFLRSQGISGILADDMGLGKTIQTLAHILAEKEAGRLDKPALIVLPTSLVHNWYDEALRFAPCLRVLKLHGLERREQFDQIPHHDLVLTTYGLLWRDQAQLAEHQYHLLILDEAQVVKNATTKASGAIRELQAKHRLCLSGTPLENHLGELWSLFDFLIPGFLGTQKQFNKQWKIPIEKHGDEVRRQLLVKRIRPFILRRKKEDVATELPPKTVILSTVDIEGGQRDLYETMRSAMHEKVRNAIHQQGLARSQIIVLDALLKLRQVCCDPRLVKKISKSNAVKESAKLDMLMNMLPELIEEGRRVLLFSQFTEMLDLIAQEVQKVGIPYVQLTGQTRNRETVVKSFQSGDVPLFLISLKAGGVGLNLTAADTVIHYDPWWNPAAENQATDRAHRMGQDKPVFVYKLIVAGSIEEKIVALQEKKALLAQGILSENGEVMEKFSDDDLNALFEPITPHNRSTSAKSGL